MTQNIKTWEEKYIHPLLPILINSKQIPCVIFLRGISGSGKTTICGILSRLLGSEKVASCSADNYFTIDGIYKFDISKISEAHMACVYAMLTALQSPKIRYIIMDNTHTQLWHLYNAETMAKKYGAQVYYIDITVPDSAHFAICLKRQCHHVPENVLLEQWIHWENHPNPIAKIPMYVSEDILY